MTLSTPDEMRGFLRMCLAPGPDRHRRTPTELTMVMPDWLLGHLAEHAPHLVAMHADVTAAEELVALVEIALNWSGVGRRPADQYRAMAQRLHHLGLLTPANPRGATFTCSGPDCDATATTDTALAVWSHPAGGPWPCLTCSEKNWSPASRARITDIPPGPEPARTRQGGSR
ncbi:hypothetical protein [Streptomyces sp. HPF1205]|uniref:hypothetical protein n=1 Tax=Streptomyces sp. HPF1205 TaxID=2873262 RepID=UPI001CEC61DC|nr:hypothetical protein [Streptomyces sp. HPF1205]